jgi:hypothetical protein
VYITINNIISEDKKTKDYNNLLFNEINNSKISNDKKHEKVYELN